VFKTAQTLVLLLEVKGGLDGLKMNLDSRVDLLAQATSPRE
jgi:hypothetical protein